MKGTRIANARPAGAAAPARPGAAVLLTSLFSATTAVLAIAGVWAFADPAGPAARFAPLSPPLAALANDHLSPGGRPVDLDAAERETRIQLALSPATASAWLRLAYIDYWRHGRLTAEGFADLARSYEIAPLGPDVSRARLTLGFELWGSMPPAVREQLLREVAALRERDREGAIAFAGRIGNPEGRLAIGMAIAVLDSEDELKASD